MKNGPLAQQGWLWPLLVALAAAVPYAHTLGHGFTFDDRPEIVGNASIRSLTNLPAFFASPTMAGSGLTTGLYRPLTTLSFALDYTLVGLNPWWFHLVNLLLHVAVSLLVLGVIRDWFDDKRIALGSAVLFAVLPVHAEAVANVAGRKELLAAAFFLATILAYRSAQASGGWRIAVPPLTYAAALLSKETGVAAFMVVVVEDLILRREQALGPKRGRTVLLLGALTVVLAGYLVARWLVIGGLVQRAVPFLDNPAAHGSTAVRLLTAIAVLGLGLRLQIAPLDLSPDYSFAAIPLVMSPLDWRFVTAVAAMAGLGLVLWLLRGQRGLLVAATLYFLTLLPASNLLFAAGTIFGERLLYLPSIAVCALFGLAWMRALGTRPWIAGLTLALVAASGAAIAARYAATWRDDATLFAAALRAQPQSAKIRYNYAVELHDAGDYQAALRQYDAAIAIYADYANAWSNRGAVRVDLGDYSGAYPDLTRAIELYPDDYNSFRNRGLALFRSGAPGRALGDLNTAIALRPDFVEALLDRALIHRTLGNPAAARADALAALQWNPSDRRQHELAEQLLKEN